MRCFMHMYNTTICPCSYYCCLGTYQYQGRWCNGTIALITYYSIASEHVLQWHKRRGVIIGGCHCSGQSTTMSETLGSTPRHHLAQIVSGEQAFSIGLYKGGPSIGLLLLFCLYVFQQVNSSHTEHVCI